MSTTLFDKLWQAHEVTTLSERQSLVYIDRIFLHERTGCVALNGLLEKQRSVRRREHAFCTMDHIVDTLPGRGDNTLMPSGRDFIVATRHAAQETGIQLFDIADADQGIVHVISPELGIALPGLSLICPDSHTCTLGGLGALAWGIARASRGRELADGEQNQILCGHALTEQAYEADAHGLRSGDAQCTGRQRMLGFG